MHVRNLIIGSNTAAICGKKDETRILIGETRIFKSSKEDRIERKIQSFFEEVTYKKESPVELESQINDKT